MQVAVIWFLNFTSMVYFTSKANSSIFFWSIFSIIFLKGKTLIPNLKIEEVSLVIFTLGLLNQFLESAILGCLKNYKMWKIIIYNS